MPISIDTELVWVALVMGVAGSAHCVGMCGGFAVLAGSGASDHAATRLNLVAWLSGKTLTYATLGLILGAAGDAVPTSFSGFQTVIVLMTALFLVATGLHMVGVGPSWTLLAPSPVSSFVSRMSALVKRTSISGRFALGLLNGLLPCGLVYAALAYSLTYQSAMKGAVFMALFGIGTVPALILIGLGTGVMSHKYRERMTRIVGWIVILLGLYTLMRLPAFMNSHHGVVPEAGHRVAYIEQIPNVTNHNHAAAARPPDKATTLHAARHTPHAA